MEVLEGIVGQLKVIKKAQLVRYRSFPLVLDQVTLLEAPFSLKDLIEKSPPECAVFIQKHDKTDQNIASPVHSG